MQVIAALDMDIEQTQEVHRAAVVNAYSAGASGVLFHRFIHQCSHCSSLLAIYTLPQTFETRASWSYGG